MPDPGPSWLSPAQAALLLGVSVSTLRGRIRRGELRAYRLRGSRLLRLRLADVEALLEPVPSGMGPEDLERLLNVRHENSGGGEHHA